MQIPYAISNDTVTLIWDNKPVITTRGNPNFQPLRAAILEERWEDIPKYLTIQTSLSEWAKGKFSTEGGCVMYEGQPLPEAICSRMFDMASRGEDPTMLFKFWERLMENPSWRSVEQLYPFLMHQGIPITEDGCFLAYKSVRDDYKDVHSASIDNSPGKIISMPRNHISDDPDQACHVGLHVGAREYASTFHSGGRLLICKVDPKDVVCIPHDHSAQKMRVCRYEVIGHDNGQHMPSTTMPNRDIGTSHFDEYEDETDGDYEEEDYGDDSYDSVPTLTISERDLIAVGAIVEAVMSIQSRLPNIDPHEVRDLIDEYQSYLNTQDKAAEALADKEEPKTRKEPNRKSKTGWGRFDKMHMDQLMKQPLEDLREYAGKGLSIVGASKIPGGKAALVAKILDVRE